MKIIKCNNINLIFSLHKKIFNLDFPLDSYNKKIKENNILIFLYKTENKYVGYSLVIDEETKRNYYCWYGGVLPEYQSQGYTIQFFEYLFKFSRKNKYKTITLATYNDRPRMINLAIKLGFDIDYIKEKKGNSGNKIYFVYKLEKTISNKIIYLDKLDYPEIEKKLVMRYKNGCSKITIKTNDMMKIKFVLKYLNNFIFKPKVYVISEVDISKLFKLYKGEISSKITISNNENQIKEKSLIELISEKYEKPNMSFNYEIKTHGITEQGHTGNCWSYSFSNVLREEIIKKFNLENFELSNNYIDFYDHLEKINLFLTQIANNNNSYDKNISIILEQGIKDGGYFSWYRDLVKKYGIVPLDAFPDTYSSKNSYEINMILSRLLRKFYIQKKKTKNIKLLKKKYYDKAYYILCEFYGVPPKKIDFTCKNKIYKDITPQDFYRKFINLDLDNYVEVISYQDEKYKYNNYYEIEGYSIVKGTPNIRYLNLPKKNFKSLIMNQIKSNELVCFYSYVSKKHINGIWTDIFDKIEDILKLDLKLDLNDIIETNETTSSHAMVLCGVNLKNSNPTKWKIENTWGSNKGFDGYYVADDNWFNKYVACAIINKKYMNRNQLEIMKNKPLLIKKEDYKIFK